jgi:hypothetical protein
MANRDQGCLGAGNLAEIPGKFGEWRLQNRSENPAEWALFLIYAVDQYTNPVDRQDRID